MATRALRGLAEPDVRAMLVPGPGPRLSLPSFLRSQWNAVRRCLGIPFRKDVQGVTPGVLRGSGATYLYLETEDLSKVAWRGRWARQKTVEFYLQEVAAQVILQRLPAVCRSKISDLRPLAAKLLTFYSCRPEAS